LRTIILIINRKGKRKEGMLRRISDVKGNEYIIRLLVILFASIAPFIMMYFEGFLPSISNYWATPMQPIFLIANATTSFYLFKIPSWKYPAILLFLLTAFSIDFHRIPHNVLSTAFFVLSSYPLLKSRHFKFCFWIYASSLIVMYFSLLAGETVAILALCIYHILLLNKVRKLNEDGEKVQNKNKS
jgi:hypothetical protein